MRRPIRSAVAVVVLAVLVPTLAGPAIAQPVVQNQPPVAGQPPVISNQRPQRYVLTSGTVVDGTPIGEDAVYVTVQTAGGPVRIEKSSIARIEFVPQAGVVAQPPPPTYSAQAYPAAPRRSRGGVALLAAGLGVFLGFYLITMFVGAIASIADEQATWLLVPVAGPMIYYQVGDLDRAVFGIMLLDTIFQSAGLVCTIIGAVLLSSPAEARAPGFRIAEDVTVTPAALPGGGGMVLSWGM